MKPSPRLDNFLVSQGHYASRARAHDAVARGCVWVNGKQAKKPAQKVPLDATIKIEDAAHEYVSRAALKLLHGLEMSNFNPAGKVCLDIGASTGGFTQVLLERDAAFVYAVDVGHDQIDDRIANDTRVKVIEGLNCRDLSPDHLTGVQPEFIVCDVSFISLRLALPPALEMAQDNAQGIFLIKPQFEVGRENIGKGGLVEDRELAQQESRSVANWICSEHRWCEVFFGASPITGSDGNQEYLLAAQKEIA